MGVALRESKPVTKIELTKEKEAEIAAMQHWEEEQETQDEVILQQEENAMLTRMRKRQNANVERRAPIDKQSAFREFKGTDTAASIEQEIISCRANLNAKR